MDPMTLAALIGGGTSLFGGLFSSKAPQQEYRSRQFPTLMPESMNAVRQSASGFGQTLPAGLEYLQGILGDDPEAMQTFKAPYMRMFHEQLIPNIAERFTGTGAGAQSSSAFQQALSQAGTSFSEKLAALHQELKGSAMDRLLNLGQLGNTQTFSTGIEKTPRSSRDIWGEALGGVGSDILSQAIKRMPLNWGSNSDSDNRSQGSAGKARYHNPIF